MRSQGVATLGTTIGDLTIGMDADGYEVVIITVPTVATPEGEVESQPLKEDISWMAGMKKRVGSSSTPKVDLPVRKVSENVYSVQSQTRADASYEVTKGEGNTWTCECPFFHHRGVECKHIRSAKKEDERSASTEAAVEESKPSTPVQSVVYV